MDNCWKIFFDLWFVQLERVGFNFRKFQECPIHTIEIFLYGFNMWIFQFNSVYYFENKNSLTNEFDLSNEKIWPSKLKKSIYILKK